MYEIKFDAGSHSYHLSFPEGFSFLCGDSGTGKSEFVQEVADSMGARMCTTFGAAVYCLSASVENPSVISLLNEALEALTYRSPGIYFVDELAFQVKLYRDLLLTALKQGGVSVIAVSRASVDSIVHGVSNTYVLEDVNGSTVNRLYFDISKLPEKQHGSILVTEDSQSSAQVYRKMFGDSCVRSANGRGNFLKAVRKVRLPKDQVVGLLDLCGMNSLLTKLDLLNDLCQLVPCECFEELVLRSKQLFPDNATIVRGLYNSEKEYAVLLDDELRCRYGIRYAKSNEQAISLLATGLFVGNEGQVVIENYRADWNTVTLGIKTDNEPIHSMSLD